MKKTHASVLGDSSYSEDRDRQLSRLTKLGFGDFVKEAEEVLSECKVSWQEDRKKDGQKERER